MIVDWLSGRGRNNHALPDMLKMAVRMRQMEASGRRHFEFDDVKPFLEEFASELASKGDILLYGGKQGEAADMFNKLAQAIFILSFAGGGVTVFGERFESRPAFCEDDPEYQEYIARRDATSVG